MRSVTELPLGTLDEAALNEQYRKKVEAEIIAVLRGDLGAGGRKGIVARRDKVLELFHQLRFWQAEYRERIKSPRAGDTLIDLLRHRMGDQTVRQVLKIMGG